MSLKSPTPLAVLAFVAVTTPAEAAIRPPLSQELVAVKGVRRPLLGTVTAETEGQITFNPYRSTNPRMVYGVERYPKSRVRSRRSAIPPHEEFHLRLAAAAGTADELCKLAEYCKKRRLKQGRLLALEAALRSDPAHKPTIKAMSSAKAKSFLQRDPLANAALGEALSTWLAKEAADDRARGATELIKTYKLPFREWYLARVHRSSEQPKGTLRDRKLTLHGDRIKGIYTLFVPDNYDPLRPTPLMIGLHGGGPGGRDGKKVVGSGSSALGLFAGQLRRRDYIAVFPNALRAPWRSPVNDALLQAVVAEIQALYNIDLNRVYLAGHSMGGYGTWHFGPKYCERWAAIAPMSGGGSNGLKKLRDTGTFVYLYHGADDQVVGCRDSRAAAKRMLDDANDFLYTELPDSGHGLPGSIVEEMFTFFDRKRRIVKGKAQLRPLSSFLAKPDKNENKFFGALQLKPGSAGSSSSKRLIQALAGGGGAGEKAAARLVELHDAKTIAPLLEILKGRKATPDSRALAARVLGELGEVKAVPILGRAVRTDHLALFRAAVTALAQIDDQRRGDLILAGITHLCRHFRTRLRGRSMHFSDWNDIVTELAFGIDKLTGLDAADKSQELHASVVTGILLADIEVAHSKRIRQNPERARTALLEATRTVLEECGDAAAKSSLAALQARFHAPR